MPLAYKHYVSVSADITYLRHRASPLHKRLHLKAITPSDSATALVLQEDELTCPFLF